MQKLQTQANRDAPASIPDGYGAYYFPVEMSNTIHGAIYRFQGGGRSSSICMSGLASG
jgi:hypothetical protein